MVANHGFIPEAFTVEQYLETVKTLGVVGGAIVSGSFQKFDQSYLRDALEKLGKGYVGVTQLPITVTDSEIRALNDVGVRAVRFNLKRGGSTEIQDISTLAQRVYDLAHWHSEFYLDSVDLVGLVKTLEKLPAISIDHLGLSKEGYPLLLKLVGQGAHVKASGFGRVDFDVKTALKEIHNINPSALMFGTDLPSTRAKRPFFKADVDLITDNFSETEAENILYNNAMRFYRITP